MYYRIRYKNELCHFGYLSVNDGYGEASYWYDDTRDPIGGHEVCVEFDPKTKKVYASSMQG